MSLEKLLSVVSRLFFLGGFVFLGLALLEKVVNLFSYTIMRKSATHMLELAVVSLVFVIAIQLRQLREEIKRGTP